MKKIFDKIFMPIALGIIFFLVLTPLGIVFRIFGKDILKLKISKNNSYWIKRKKNINTMDKQF
tara:strand:- start:652 stop:840 length:189 start_codon:yes stop_codon:yes gene_type:complete